MNRFLLSFTLAASLIVPAAAQQSNTSNTQNQNDRQAATTTQTSSSQQSSDDLSARQPLQPQTHEGFWGHLNPFARKKYVQKQMAPVRNRVNELDELTANNTRMLKDVDSRATEGIRQASAKANEADQHALAAGQRAQQAHETAQQAATRLQSVEQVVGSIDQYQPATQSEVMFRSGQSVLSKRAKESLDELVANTKDQKGYIFQIQGFSPGRGQSAIQSSQAMAQAVARYLVIEHQVPVYRIFVVGMGNAPIQTAEGKSQRVRGGRVEVTLMKNGISQLSQTASAAQGAPMQGGATGAAYSTGAASGNGQSQQQGVSSQAAPWQQNNSQQQTSAQPNQQQTAPQQNPR